MNTTDFSRISSINNPFWDVLADLKDDLEEMTSKMSRKMIDWTTAMIRGDLSLDELKDLLEGERDLLEMTALQKRVETKVLLNTLKRNLIDELLEAVKKAL